MNWKIAFVLAACAAALAAQTPPVTILEVEIRDYVLYHDDVPDPSKFATSPGVTPLAPDYNWVFNWASALSDIVAVNGKPARGFKMTRSYQPRYSTANTPRRAIADINGNCAADALWAILQPDGTTRIGTIVATGFGGAAPPAGAPADVLTHDMAVVGGTGAFLGVRGQAGRGRVFITSRNASMREDPANRRVNGGGHHIEILHLIPLTWPEVLTVPTGPAIFHGDDFSPVTSEKPARAGELLMMSVSGLGPVKPNLGPGKPFPAWQTGKEHQVNSPVEVTVNGKAAAVTSAIGWPGMNNVYRVDFRVPEGTVAGTAALGLSVAWINGPEVKIPVR